MSILTKTMDIINVKYLEARGSVLRFLPICENPRIFLMTKGTSEPKQKLGFYHVCHPRELYGMLIALTYKNLNELNDLLNEHLAQVVDVGGETVCGKCFLKIPQPIVNKLAIINASDKLTLR